MANRYTQLTPSTFNPLSLQEIFTVPLAKQKQHDAALAKLDESGMFDIKYLDKDKELASNYIKNYQGELDKVSNQIMERGIDNLSKRQVLKLAKDRDEWLKRGEGADIVANYNAYQQNAKSLKEQYEKGDISRDVYLLGLNKAKNSYKGVSEGDTYSPFTAVKDSEYMKKASDIAKAMSDNPTKITELAPTLQYNAQTGKYVDTKTNREYNQEGAIKLAVQAGLALDNEVMSDLKQRQQLGILGKQSVPEYLNSIATQNEFVYRKNNQVQSRQFVGVDANAFNNESNNPNTRNNYEADNPVTVAQRFNGLTDRLDDVNNGNLDIRDTELVNYAGIMTGRIKPAQLSAQQNKDYLHIVDGLKRNGVIDANISPVEETRAIQKYLDKYSEVTFQPIVYTNGLYRTYDNQTDKVKTSTSKDLFDGIKQNAERRTFIDLESGEAINIKEMSQEDRELLYAGKGEVSGAYSPRNFLSDQYPELNPNVTAAPLEILLENGKKYLSSRSDGEINSKSYQSAIKTNEIWKNISYPNIDYSTQIPGLGDVKITRKVQLDEPSGYVTQNNISIQLPSGRQFTLQGDNHLEAFIDKIYSKAYIK